MVFSTDIEDLLYYFLPGKKYRLRNMTHIAGKASLWLAAPLHLVLPTVEQRRHRKVSLPVSQKRANVALGLH